MRRSGIAAIEFDTNRPGVYTVPMATESKFRVWAFRTRYMDGKKSGGYVEPAEAADFAEELLDQWGIPGESYCEIRYNGDEKPHTVICYLGESRFGIFNNDHAPWPLFYPPDDYRGEVLSDFTMDDEALKRWQEADEAKKGEKSDEGNMRLDEIPDEEGEEFDGDEGAEDEEVPADGDEAAGDSDAEDDEAEDDGADDDEAGEDDAEEDEGDPSEAEDEDDHGGEEEPGDDEQEDDEEDEDGGEDFSDGDEDTDSEEEQGEEVDDSDDEEEEIEMPRLNIFAKFRGPLGWRKRAEAEELNERNTFALKLGILNPEGEKTAEQEREVFAEFQFIESDDERDAGILRMKLPPGVEFSDPTKAGWVTARIPYRTED